MSENSKKVQISEFEEKLRESSREPVQPTGATDARHEQFKIERDEKIAPDEKVIPVIEEQAHIEKRTVETGKVRISKNVREDEVLVDVPIVHEEVDVQRVPVNKFVDQAPPAVRYEGDKMIISVLREELVLVKRIKLVEELHIVNRKTEEHRTEPIQLRREEINIEHLKNNNAGET